MVVETYNLLELPFHLLASEQACHQDTEYKKGVLQVVAPLLTNLGGDDSKFDAWPEGADSILESSPLYQSYLGMPCGLLLERVARRERTAREQIYNKNRKQEEYERYISRNPESSSLLQAANRRWPAQQRILTKSEVAYKRLSDAREAFLKQDEQSLGEVYTEARGKVVCLWNNATVESVCGLALDAASIAVGGGVALKAGAGAAARRAAARHATGRELSQAERSRLGSALLGRRLTSQQRVALQRAHEVGSGRPGAGIGNYTQAEISEKTRILREAGFSVEETRKLMEEGLAGTYHSSRSVANAGIAIRQLPMQGEYYVLSSRARSRTTRGTEEAGDLLFHRSAMTHILSDHAELSAERTRHLERFRRAARNYSRNSNPHTLEALEGAVAGMRSEGMVRPGSVTSFFTDQTSFRQVLSHLVSGVDSRGRRITLVGDGRSPDGRMGYYKFEVDGVQYGINRCINPPCSRPGGGGSITEQGGVISMYPICGPGVISLPPSERLNAGSVSRRRGQTLESFISFQIPCDN